MKVGFFSEADLWSVGGERINTPENLRAIRKVLEDVGPIIVEHWFYRRSSAPDRIVFDDFEDFEKYLNHEPRAGDKIQVWSFAEVCTPKNALASGKCPDDQGRVPKKGSY